MSDIKDSGERTDFANGAVREIREENGRCDLLPLKQVAMLFDNDYIVKTALEGIDDYVYNGKIAGIVSALKAFCKMKFQDSMPEMILMVSLHYKDALSKYPERNWEKGLPTHSFVDSGVRHLLKIARGDQDEPHNNAFIWNMLGILWNDEHHPELVDMPFVDKLLRPNKYVPEDTSSTIGDTVSDRATISLDTYPSKDRTWSYINRSSTKDF
nr:MAG TPA: hypothetical protein [Caudoviricetes sp.]